MAGLSISVKLVLGCHFWSILCIIVLLHSYFSLAMSSLNNVYLLRTTNYRLYSNISQVLLLYQTKGYFNKFDSMKPLGVYYFNVIIPHPVASEHRWLVKAPRWIHSVPDVSGRRSWHCGCYARLWNPHDVTNTSRLWTLLFCTPDR